MKALLPLHPLLLVVLLIVSACDRGVKPTQHSVPNDHPLSAEEDHLIYSIADTMLWGHHIRVDRYSCTIRVTRDDKQSSTDWIEYDGGCEWPESPYEGVMVIVHGKVISTNLIAFDSTEIYFGVIEPACRGVGHLYHCKLMADGGFSLLDEDSESYTDMVIVDPVRRRWLTRNHLPDIVIHDGIISGKDSVVTEEWYTVFHRHTLRSMLAGGDSLVKFFRVDAGGPLGMAFQGSDEDASDEVALTLYRRFMR